MSWLMLALIMACLGWAYDARLIRSVAMSLKTREFTQSSVFSGMTTREILVQEHLPYVMPIVFSTTMNNMVWSIGLEVTLAVLGFTDINTPTIGGMIYWANQHTAMVAGVWWWIAFPTIAVIMTFIGLFLLAVSMNEYIDPRSRLSRMPEGRRDHRAHRCDDAPSPIALRRSCRCATCRRTSAPTISASSATSRRSTASAFDVQARRDLRARRRIQFRQDHADQDHRRRHQAAAGGRRRHRGIRVPAGLWRSCTARRRPRWRGFAGGICPTSCKAR